MQIIVAPKSSSRGPRVCNRGFWNCSEGEAFRQSNFASPHRKMPTGTSSRLLDNTETLESTLCVFECPPPTLPQKNCHLSFIDHLIRAVGLVLICEIRHGRRFAWHPQATKVPRQGTACHYRMVFYSLSIWSRRVHVTDGNSLVCKRRHVKCDEVSSRPVGSPKKVTDPNVPGSPTMWALRQGPTPMRLWWQRYCITTD